MIDYGKKNITIHSDNFLGNEIDKETLRPITENHFFPTINTCFIVSKNIY